MTDAPLGISIPSLDIEPWLLTPAHGPQRSLKSPLHVGAGHMQRGELRPHRGQAQLSRCDLMAERATELLEAPGLALLLRAAVFFLHLRDDVHGGEQRDASLEVLAHLLAAIRKAQLSAFAQGVAIVAAVMFEDEVRQLVGGHARWVHLGKAFRRRRWPRAARTQCRRQGDAEDHTQRAAGALTDP